MRVAIVDEGLPFPLTTGKRIRSFGLISRLAKKHDISYFAYSRIDREENIIAKEQLSRLGITPILVPHRVPQDRGIGFGVRLARNLFSSLPYSVDRHMSKPMRKTIEQNLSSYDIWHCEWTPYAELFRNLEVNRLIIDAHNIESHIWQRYYESERTFHRRWFIKKQWAKFKAFERWAFSRANHTIVVSQGDADLALDEFGARDITIVENGVDTTYFQPGHSSKSPHQLLILGSLFWRPNIEGVRLFLDKVFPRVLELEPSTRLRIVGRDPPRWLIEYAEKRHQINVHGNVADVRPYLADAGMLVVPLLVGGGSRLKILEAAAAGVPVVSTRIGAEGLDLVDEKHLMLANTIEDLIELIVRCIRNYSSCERQSIAARELIVNRHDWKLLANKLDDVWRGEGRFSKNRDYQLGNRLSTSV